MAESTESRKGLNTGIPIATSALLSAAAPLLLVWIAQVYGWRISLYAITIPGIIIGFLLMKFMRESKVTNVSDQKNLKCHSQILKWF